MESNKIIYVHPYADSENQDDCIVLYRVNFANKLTPIVTHLGNINLKQRFIIKGDKGLQKVQSFDGANIILSENCICYPIEDYMTGQAEYSPLLPTILSMIQPTMEGLYRFSSKINTPKIVFF
jgi:hypothetical protein